MYRFRRDIKDEYLADVSDAGKSRIDLSYVFRRLHSLEQEIADLRAQLAVYQQADPDASGTLAHPPISRGSATPAPAFRPPTPRHDPHSLTIDPALTQDQEAGPRSWDSPGHAHSSLSSHLHMRRASEISSPTPHSPSVSSAMNPKSQALTRMVHDAALRTGHAVHQANAISAFSAPGVGYSSGHSDKGSVAYSPADDAVSPQLLSRTGAGARHSAHSTPGGQGYGNLPGNVSSHGSESGRSKRKPFSVPPLPPQPAIERLVAAFVDFVGVTAPIIHIPTLGQQLQKIRAGTDVEESDVFVVMMVLGESALEVARRFS
jgi:hypothetical protein